MNYFTLTFLLSWVGFCGAHGDFTFLFVSVVFYLFHLYLLIFNKELGHQEAFGGVR